MKPAISVRSSLPAGPVMTREQRACGLSDPEVQEVIDGPEYAALFE